MVSYNTILHAVKCAKRSYFELTRHPITCPHSPTIQFFHAYFEDIWWYHNASALYELLWWKYYHMMMIYHKRSLCFTYILFAGKSPLWEPFYYYGLTVVRAWISNYHCFMWDMITHPCHMIALVVIWLEFVYSYETTLPILAVRYWVAFPRRHIY